jgi:FAD/FMN-containing dehydrogenase
MQAAAAQAVDTLTSLVRGQVVRPQDPTYDEVRQVHNGMIDRRPAVIVRCSGTADVLHCVRAARENDLLVSVRGGGHGVAGFAVCEGGLMIDLSTARGVRVDCEQRTAHAQGGATWGDFDHETQAFGLATTGGVVRATGIAGLTLAGGHGLLMRKYGLVCDNLLSVDLVTADGRLIRANAEDNADLFWGLRGGGGNFGIATSFEYRLHPVGPVLGGLLLYPLAQARNVLKFYDEFTSTAPDELGALAALATLPDGTKAAVILLAYAGDLERAEAAVRPLRNCAPLLADQVAAMPYTAFQSIVENFNPRGLRNYWKTAYLARSNDDVIDAMIDYHARVTSPFTHQVLYTLGGAVGRAAADDTAVAYREARHIFIAIGMWDGAAADEANIAYVRRLWDTVQPFSSGGFYPNYEADAAPGQVKAAFGTAKYERLLALKRKYDPGNFFRLNQNINPI